MGHQQGYRIRYENLVGTVGSTCEIAGQRYLFVDLTLSANEQLDQVITALQADSNFDCSELPSELKSWLEELETRVQSLAIRSFENPEHFVNEYENTICQIISHHLSSSL